LVFLENYDLPLACYLVQSPTSSATIPPLEASAAPQRRTQPLHPGLLVERGFRPGLGLLRRRGLRGRGSLPAQVEVRSLYRTLEN
jgi:hypothetical protein